MKLVTKELLVQWRDMLDAVVRAMDDIETFGDTERTIQRRALRVAVQESIDEIKDIIDAPDAAAVITPQEREALDKAISDLEADHKNEVESFRKTIRVLVKSLIKVCMEKAVMKAVQPLPLNPFKESVGGCTNAEWLANAPESVRELVKNPPWPKEEQPDGTTNEVDPADMAPKPQTPPFKCLYCGAPSWVDPSDQSPPPGHCHDDDHGSPDLCAEPDGSGA